MDSIVNKPLGRSQALDMAALIDDHKGEGTVILDVTGECSFADYFIITTAMSSRHAASLIGFVREFVDRIAAPVLNRRQAADQSGWALLDCGNIIVHVMEREARSFYELEKLWFRAKPLSYRSARENPEASLRG